MAELTEIAEVVRNALAAHPACPTILGVEVRDIYEDDEFMTVWVYYKGRYTDLNIDVPISAVSLVERPLQLIGEHRFPVFSFIDEKDMPKRAVA